MEIKNEDKNFNPYFNEDKGDRKRKRRRRNVFCIFPYDLR